MKIPLAYPKIPDGANCPLKQCIAFEKLDGTNLHWVWDNGWVSFGTRRHRYSLDKSGIDFFKKEHPELDEESGPCKYFNWEIVPGSDSLFDRHKIKKAVLFTEWCGFQSFAGQHNPNDPTKILVPFDLEVDGKMMPPVSFINLFQGYRIPKIVFRGKYTGQFVEDVRNGKYPVKEGVVVKGMVKDQVYMTKIKTNDYMEKLKDKFQDSWQDYWE